MGHCTSEMGRWPISPAAIDLASLVVNQCYQYSKKAAHRERAADVLGIQRWFTDDVASVAAPFLLPAAAVSPGFQEKTHFGWGIGGSVLLPVIPKFLDLQGSVLTGQGLGRYGSSQLADVTIGPDGTLKPLTTMQILLGLVAHP